MVMVNKAGPADQRPRPSLPTVLYWPGWMKCANRDHALTAKKFVFSYHVNEAFNACLRMDRLMYGGRLVLTIIH